MAVKVPVIPVKGGMMQPLNYNTIHLLPVSGDFLWYYINNFTCKWAPTFKTTFLHSLFYQYIFL